PFSRRVLPNLLKEGGEVHQDVGSIFTICGSVRFRFPHSVRKRTARGAKITAVLIATCLEKEQDGADLHDPARVAVPVRRDGGCHRRQFFPLGSTGEKR